MKVLLVVPVYNCEPVVHQVVAELLQKTQLSLLVVDDGSVPPLNLDEDDRLSLLRLNENKGKGMALQKAIHWAVENNFTHILSFDGDGQHLAVDVEKLLNKLKSDESALIIGARLFNDSVPVISRFGRKFSNFWVRYQTGVKVSDSQSGFRLYPLIPLKNMKFFTKRYDFEIEVLVRALWSGVTVKEVDVGVVYGSKSERITHFHKIWDNARITFLNIVLIAYSLIFHQRSFLKALFAGGFAFVASLTGTLTWAFFVGLFVCVLFRVNVILFSVALLCLALF